MTRSTPGSGSECCCKNNVRYENNCFVKVKVYFKNIRVRVHIRVQLYSPFPTTRTGMSVDSVSNTHLVARR